jgi:hypothetical protein
MSARERPFSNGSEYRDWTDRNCKAGCAHYTEPQPTCPLELALGLAYFGDGTVTHGVAKRLGCYATDLGYPATPCPEFVTFTVRGAVPDQEAR